MSTLSIPVRIQGLFLEHDQQVSAPSTDFSQLPWYDEKQGTDVNFTTPFISKYCLRQPFQGPDSLLGKGVHLHFVIPHYLGRRVPKGLPGEENMPAVPNRWVVVRKKNGINDKNWFIESDYIHHESYTPTYYSCTIPFHKGRPYRHLGRVREYQETFPAEDPNKSYFKRLNGGNAMTALGAGDIHFASFYPNCNTAFGLYDPEGKLDAETTYAVMGWHSDVADDLLFSSIKHWKPDGKNNADIQANLKHYFGLELDSNDKDQKISEVTSSLFYGEFQFDKKPDDPDPKKIKVAVGTTGTEALSAHLASDMAGDRFAGAFASNKRNIENILESALMFPKLDGEQVDVGPKFEEARHTAGFRPAHGGHVWKIQVHVPNPEAVKEETESEANQEKATSDADQEKGETESKKETVPVLPSIPTGLGEKLEALNQAQAKYHREHQKIITQQRQLYADWIKYMEARYPPEANESNDIADHIMYFLLEHGISPLLQQMAETGRLTYKQNEGWKPEPDKYDPWEVFKMSVPNLDAQELIVLEEQIDDRLSATSNEPARTLWEKWKNDFTKKSTSDLANKVLSAWDDLTRAINQENDDHAESDHTLFLNRIDGPRFWEPKAPVVLLTGLEEGVSKVNQKIEILEVDRSGNSFIQQPTGKNLQQYSKQYWSPFLMDWEFDLHQTTDLQKGNFSEGSILSNFELNETRADFLMKGNTSFQATPSVFSGTVLLSAHTRNTYQKSIEAFFDHFLKKNNVQLSKPKTLTDFLMEKDWKKASSDTYLTNPQVFDSVHSINPYQKLQEAYRKIEPQHFLSQTLDGFYESCVQLRKVTQFPIAEPIGFGHEQQFTELVKATVQMERHLSPEIAFDFNPLPSGKFYLNRLQVLDNFGVSTTIPTNYVVPFAEPLCDENNEAFLKPRIAQPARLNFQWLSAIDLVKPTDKNKSAEDDPGTPTNDDPVTSPICGWLVNNYLDNTLMVYDADGNGLGSLEMPEAGADKLKWKPVPWSSDIEKGITDCIKNTHLQKVVLKIESLTNFLSDTENALHHISPHEALQHPLRNDLVGKPMAVVRAAVDLKLEGVPHLDQSWPSLLHDLQNCHRKTTWGPEDRNDQNWTDVQFPCRIGEHMQLNDGLIGYWVENNQSPEGDFIAPQIENQADLDQGVNEYTPGVFQGLSLKLNGEKTQLSMIMDPHGLIHATTGILPTKVLSIPPEHYLPQLKKLKVWFRSSPILQPQGLEGKVQLDLPNIPEMEWRWWDPSGMATIEKSTQGSEARIELREGWLLLEELNEDQKSDAES